MDMGYIIWSTVSIFFLSFEDLWLVYSRIHKFVLIEIIVRKIFEEVSGTGVWSRAARMGGGNNRNCHSGFQSLHGKFTNRRGDGINDILHYCINYLIQCATEEQDLINSISSCWSILAIHLLGVFICREMKWCLTPVLVEYKPMTNIYAQSNCSFQKSSQQKPSVKSFDTSSLIHRMKNKIHIHIIKSTTNQLRFSLLCLLESGWDRKNKVFTF